MECGNPLKAIGKIGEELQVYHAKALSWDSEKDVNTFLGFFTASGELLSPSMFACSRLTAFAAERWTLFQASFFLMLEPELRNMVMAGGLVFVFNEWMNGKLMGPTMSMGGKLNSE